MGVLLKERAAAGWARRNSAGWGFGSAQSFLKRIRNFTAVCRAENKRAEQRENPASDKNKQNREEETWQK